MMNHLTGYAYTGKNEAAILEAGYDHGDAFVTFKQALKVPGIVGKNLKGLKADVKLVRYVWEKDPITGKEEKKPRYFGVFHINSILARKVK